MASICPEPPTKARLLDYHSGTVDSVNPLWTLAVFLPDNRNAKGPAIDLKVVVPTDVV